ncbi:MAG: hypothetical protein LBH28_06045 [Oscillospiraceae bacterium]|jgi:hypothetical protein|nr:hypothetical protein [Oscillospiraceae bacterium]
MSSDIFAEKEKLYQSVLEITNDIMAINNPKGRIKLLSDLTQLGDYKDSPQMLLRVLHEYSRPVNHGGGTQGMQLVKCSLCGKVQAGMQRCVFSPERCVACGIEFSFDC